MQRTIQRQPEVYPDLWELIGVVAAALAFTLLGLWMLISQTISPAVTSALDADLNTDPRLAQTAFAAETGVWIVGVSLVAGGGMVDLRYQIVDPDKAVIVHDDENPPGLLIESTGQIVNTPYHDHSDFDAHQAVTYHELIMNPAGVLKKGMQVSVLIGQSRLEHITIH
ncbi:MAG: hypothetical protein D6784_13040 [Chloroflexi bacterium]|nr:MAG: hypothetical protein D6784_13040 [Chloroflexota bacterium]